MNSTSSAIDICIPIRIRRSRALLKGPTFPIDDGDWVRADAVVAFLFVDNYKRCFNDMGPTQST